MFLCPADNCNVCKSSKAAVHRHIKEQHKNFRWKCCKCAKTFAQRKGRYKHELKHKYGFWFACNEAGCGYHCMFESEMLEHCKKHSRKKTVEVLCWSRLWQTVPGKENKKHSRKNTHCWRLDLWGNYRGQWNLWPRMRFQGNIWHNTWEVSMVQDGKVDVAKHSNGLPASTRMKRSVHRVQRLKLAQGRNLIWKLICRLLLHIIILFVVPHQTRQQASADYFFSCIF